MKHIAILCFLVVLTGCAKLARGPTTPGDTSTRSTVRHGERATVILSGVQELDVELVSFCATVKRRQTWILGFQKLTDPEQFTIEVFDCDFVESFKKSNSVFMKEYEEEQMWGKPKAVSPHLRFHVKIDPRSRYARILEWKAIE